MARLIRENPEQALREALRFDEYESLPESVRAQMERPFSAVARYDYYPVCRAPAGFPDHVASMTLPDLNGGTLDAFVYGQRGGVMSKRSLPVQGIALDGAAAMHDAVLREVVAPEELATVARLFPLAQADPARSFATGEVMAGQPTVALAGGKRYLFASHEELAAFNQALAKLDELPGPNAGSNVLYAAKPADGAAFDLPAAQGLAQAQADQWTETEKKVFIIRVDFSDRTGADYPQATVAANLNTTVSDQIRAMSYGKTWITAAVSANVYRMPQASAYYINGSSGDSRNNELLRDARNTFRNTRAGGDAAISIGPVSNSGAGGDGGLGDYDIVGVAFTSMNMRSGFAYAGLAGGGDLWIQGTNSASVYAHEFGHNYGVGHSSFWQTSDNSVVGAGASVEYGDIFDLMGDGGIPEGHYHPQAKAKLNWLSTGEWADATATGSNTYRIYRIDSQSTTGTPRGLRITKSAAAGGQYYWLGYRPAYANLPHLQSGAYMVWQRPGETRSWLLDSTPATSGDKSDAPIDIGRTYADTSAQVYITPLATGGSGAERYLDVRVNLGPFPGNSAPGSVSITGPATVSARTDTVFSVAATDANGDTLAYFWDTGDGIVHENAATVTLNWPVGGTYTLKVTVSDMKGGAAAPVTKTITVSDPMRSFVNRTPAGVSGDFQAVAAGGGRVVAVGSRFSGNFAGPRAWSTDGVTWNTGNLGSNSHLHGLAYDGTQFIGAGMQYDFSSSAFEGWIVTSPNGETWTTRYFTGTPLNAIACGNGIYLAAGEGGSVLRSLNGIDWNAVSIPGVTGSVIFEGLAWNGAQFALVGYTDGTSANGGVQVFTSADGLTWVDHAAGTGLADWQDLRKVAWLNDRFVASGWYSKLRISTDSAATFTTTRTDVEETPAMAYGNGVYFAAGVNRDASDADVDILSTDGQTWYSFPAATTVDRNGAVFFNNTFITVGDSASIWQSGTLSPPTGFTAWRITHFPGGGARAQATADPDNDSLLNIVEYALGTDPNAGGDTPGSVVTQSGRAWLHVDIPEPAPADVNYVVQGNTGLISGWTELARKSGAGAWNWVGGGASHIQLGTVSGGYLPTEIGMPDSALSQPRYFLRLVIQQP